MNKHFCYIAYKNIFRNKVKSTIFLLLITCVILLGIYTLEMFLSVMAINSRNNKNATIKLEDNTMSIMVFTSKICLYLLIISAIFFVVALFIFCQNKLAEEKSDLAVLKAIGYKNTHLLIITILETGSLSIIGYVIGSFFSSVIFLLTQYFLRITFNIYLPFQISSYLIVLVFQLCILLISNIITIIRFKMSDPILILKE